MATFDELKEMSEKEQQEVAKDVIEFAFHDWAKEKSNTVTWEDFKKVEKMNPSEIKINFLDDENFREVDADCELLKEPIQISE